MEATHENKDENKNENKNEIEVIDVSAVEKDVSREPVPYIGLPDIAGKFGIIII